MKKFLHPLLMFTKHTIYGIIIQSILSTTLLAIDGKAQLVQNIKEVNLTVELKDADMKEVFETLENETNYIFNYNLYDLDPNIKISGKYKDEPLYNILVDISKKADVKFKQFNNNISVRPYERGSKGKNVIEVVLQNRTVSGKVTSSENHEGIPGVNVLLKGTSQGTVTDINGEFNIDVPSPESILVFSSIGFVPEEIVVGTQSVVNLEMTTDVTALEEVVVVGYGTQSKVDVTGSVVTMDGDEIVKSKTPNVINSLTGQLAGVVINNRTGEPGRDDPSIYIRGRSTIGDASPLFIIDGVQRPDLGRLNPNDIENISVLKDASAAIYGARAANGVILVTTKRGKQGKPIFDFSYNQGFSQPTRNPKMADSYTWARVSNEINPGTYSDDDLQKFQEGTEPGFTTTDWYDEMTRSSTPQHQLNLSASGGNESVNYYVSLGQLTQDGHFNHGSTKIKRYNFRSNLDVHVNEYVTVGLDLSGRQDNRHYPGNPDTRGIYSHIYLYHPYWTLFWPGTEFKRPLRDNENLINWVSDDGGYQDELYRALESKLHFDVDIPWVSGLSIRGTANYDVGYNHIKTWTLPTYVYYRDEDTGEYYEGRSGVRADLAQLAEEFNQRATTTLNFRIDYEKSIGKSNIGAMVGYEQLEYDFNYISAGRSDYPSTVLPQIFAGSSDKTKQTNDGSASKTSRQNYFGRINYDYDQRYLAQFIFRYDGSPNFPKDKRWGFFPGVSLGWRISEESFMENANAIDNLKIRGSYGEMGNDSIPEFQYLTSYEYNPDYNYVIGGNDVIGMVQSGTPNPNITWEVAKMTNIGFELSLWEGSLAMEFDYFKTKRSNILVQRSAIVPDYTGLLLPDENIGEVQNKGFELQLMHRKNLNNLSYTIGGNISYAKNEVIFADEPPAAEEYQLAAGKPIGAGLYYNALGIFSNQEEVDSYPTLPGAQPGDIKYEDVNNDGILNSRDQIRVDRTATPQIVYAINGSINYANFDLTVLFQGQENAVANFDETDNYFPVLNVGLGNFLQWRADGRWTPENTNASQPRADGVNSNNNTQPSTHWTVNAGFLRLKNVELGYTFPIELSKKVGMEYLRLYVNGNNLFMIYDHMKDLGFDPETSDYWFYPQQRTFNFGVNLSF